jgi:hypothetical protein
MVKVVDGRAGPVGAGGAHVGDHGVAVQLRAGARVGGRELKADRHPVGGAQQVQAASQK